MNGGGAGRNVCKAMIRRCSRGDDVVGVGVWPNRKKVPHDPRLLSHPVGSGFSFLRTNILRIIHVRNFDFFGKGRNETPPLSLGRSPRINHPTVHSLCGISGFKFDTIRKWYSSTDHATPAGCTSRCGRWSSMVTGRPTGRWCASRVASPQAACAGASSTDLCG